MTTTLNSKTFGTATVPTGEVAELSIATTSPAEYPEVMKGLATHLKAASRRDRIVGFDGTPPSDRTVRHTWTAIGRFGHEVVADGLSFPGRPERTIVKVFVDTPVLARGWDAIWLLEQGGVGGVAYVQALLRAATRRTTLFGVAWMLGGRTIAVGRSSLRGESVVKVLIGARATLHGADAEAVIKRQV